MKCLNAVFTVLVVSLLTGPAMAAREWKNPDEVKPEAIEKAKPAPVKKEIKKTSPSVLNLSGSHGLAVTRVCNYQRTYRDKGSGGKIDGSFYVPRLPQGFMMIGGYAQGNYDDPAACVIAVRPGKEGSESLLRVPDEWKRVWTDKGTGARKDGSIWHPGVTDDNYSCIGSVAVEGYKKPAITKYACLHRCLLEEMPVAAPVWSTSGTGAKHKIYIYNLSASNGFYASGQKLDGSRVLDLKPNPQCEFQ